MLRTDSYLSLLIIDIDHFKKINDQFGHLIGDECLKRLSNLLKKEIKRETDTVARYGGEEFVVILPYTGLKDAVNIAENLRKKVMALDSQYGEAVVKFTVSIGVTTCLPRPGISGEALIELADNAMYTAKNSGRNRVETNAFPNELDERLYKTEGN